MNTDEILALYQQGEGPDLEFKSENTKPSKLAETLIALANAQGGVVLIGVNGRTGEVEGVRDPRLTREAAIEATLLCEPPLILPLPEVTSLQEKPVIAVVVPEGLPNVYSLNGRYLARVGSLNKPMPAATLRRLLIERGEITFEMLADPRATFADLDLNKVADYARAFRWGGNMSMEELLLSRGCLTRDKDQYRPTNAGILLFGAEPQKFFMNAQIILVQYPGLEMGDEFIREDIGGTLEEQIDAAELFLVRNMRKTMRLVGLGREEVTEYPVEAVREMVVNAVAHRDYSIRGEAIRISMFNDRVECYSPGRLPGHVTVQNILEERFSRNEAIVQVLADRGYIERLGYGINRMIQIMKDHGAQPPLFEERAGGFQVTLHAVAAELTADPAEMAKWLALGLNERQIRALQYLSTIPRITNREFRRLCPDVSNETIRSDLADLVDRNILLKIGDKRATYYILK
ncbi:MAG: helix-turn-helix domain-containing protein [Chloroflexi bacterium]|nr:helix-turn-helix domain-containing protein [Chloroflexota bacterium]MBU1752075.1 helix-turn-helix domain-containing protein [Chloroflexota bacterium]MBU1879398.1 helix-turn-helix domain-containing protein [Chloroflexota bacterium]